MWCERCQAEVSAQASADKDRLLCENCGLVLAIPEAPGSVAGEFVVPRSVRDPRELLARWAREEALEAIDSSSTSKAPTSEKSARTKANLRFDGSHSPLRPPVPLIEKVVEQTPPAVAASTPVSATPENDVPRTEHVVHQAHRLNPPHFPLAPAAKPDQSSKWVTLVGQIFAYFGVGGLTIGTVLVLMGYFGGPASYATTGWLVATAGQMLLFLGVITLVSGGMEQTTQEVARRIDTIGERLVRIEQAAWSGRSTDESNTDEFPTEG